MGAFEKEFSLSVPSSTENLVMIREFIAQIGSQIGLGRPDIIKLEIAVDEACTNIIEHAYGHDITKTVIVQVNFDDENLRINIIDKGNGFDPDLIKPEEIAELVAKRRSGGLGIRLMKSIMDEVRYEIEPGKKNQLHMIKRLKKP
jgi:serine/threonine-protein kinase RsbW